MSITTITARSIIDFTDHFIVHHWTRYRKLQWYNDSMNNDNNQWSTSQLVYDVDRYNDTMNNDIDNDGNPVIGPRDWKQQKFQAKFGQLQLSRCFKQNWYSHLRCSRPSKAMTRRMLCIAKCLKYIQSTENRKQAAANCIIYGMTLNWK